MPRTATPFTYISYYLGDEKTETLLRDLMDKVQPKILDSSGSAYPIDLR